MLTLLLLTLGHFEIDKYSRNFSCIYKKNHLIFKILKLVYEPIRIIFQTNKTTLVFYFYNLWYECVINALITSWR